MACPKPLLPQADYPELGGDIGGRSCATLPLPGSPQCCVPCPRQEFFYPDTFIPLIKASTYLNLAGVVCCVFLLLSFVVLSVEYTNRHYLSVCLVGAILIMQTSFVIPMGSKSSQCFDAITPHDMYSSVNCAMSGAFLLGGGWCVAMWIFLRTLSLHLQICWQVVPGRRFFLSAQAVGWSIPVVFLAIALVITGVSFRFGDSCHINSKDGLKTFWGPLLGVTAASIITQFVTFCYCVKVYITSLLDDTSQGNTTLDTPLPYATSVRTITPRQALRRVQRVIALQWRGIMVVIVIITDVIFFATVFLKFEDTTEKTPENTAKAAQWLTCLLISGGDKNRCLDYAAKLVIPEKTAVAVLYLLSCNGVWALLLIGRVSMLVGWWHLIKDTFVKKKSSDEFASYSARNAAEPDPSYEMLGSKKTDQSSTKNGSIISPVSPAEGLRTPASTHQIGIAKPYQPSRSSMLSSIPSSPEGDNRTRTPQFAPQFSSYLYKGDNASEAEAEYAHGLSPKPSSISHAR